MRRFKYAVLAVLVVLVLLAGAGCDLIPAILSPAAVTETPTPSTPSPINPTYSPPPTGSGSEELPTIADVVAKVRPSVVAINTEFTDIFSRTQRGAGSGWIIDSKGLIVTNNHVVEGAKTVNATLENGQTYTANTIRTDPINDLAVIDIGVDDLPAVTVGDSSKLRVGDWVLAIGNALGQGIRATEGIISNTGVNITVDSGETLYNLLETTAAINPGNSGGPLVNLSGEVIGITSAKLAAVGVEGMGYAISSNTASPIIHDLITKGYVSHPWLGISVADVNQLLILRYNLAVDKGGFLSEVLSGSPADKAGLKPGDVVVSFGGKEITTADGLVQAIRRGQIGQTVEIKYYREKDQLTTSATLEERPLS